MEEKRSPMPSFRNASSELSIENEDRAILLKKAHRKVDKHLLLWYSFVYLIMRVHVSNISNTAAINIEPGSKIKKHFGNLTSE
jgi:hypothetical protein